MSHAARKPYYNDRMTEQFLSLRLSADDAALMAQLHAQTGLSKSDIVKRALRQLADAQLAPAAGGLFALGQSSFGRQGDATRQSAKVKRIVRDRLQARQR